MKIHRLSFQGQRKKKNFLHIRYNFYLSSYSDTIKFKRDPIDFLFARIVGSFFVYYSICYLLSAFVNKYKQEIYLFNKIGRHIFYDDTTNIYPTLSHHVTTIHSNNDKEEHSKKIKKSDTLWFYSKNYLKTNGNYNVSKKSSSNNITNDNSNYRLKPPQGKTEIKIVPLKSKNYFGKINRKPTTLNFSCVYKIKFLCCSLNTKETRYIYLMQSFFEIATHLSSTADII